MQVDGRDVGTDVGGRDVGAGVGVPAGLGVWVGSAAPVAVGVGSAVAVAPIVTVGVATACSGTSPPPPPQPAAAIVTAIKATNEKIGHLIDQPPALVSPLGLCAQGSQCPDRTCRRQAWQEKKLRPPQRQQ